MSPKKIHRASESFFVPGNRAGGLRGLIFRRELPRENPGRSGFTFVEILVALCIGAMVVAAVAMAYGSIVLHGPIRTRSENVSISAAVFQNFYGVSQDTVAVSQAPDYGSAAMAESMREKFHSDVSSAIAVFCLGRNGLSSAAMRLSTLTNAGRTNVSPEDFRALIDASATVFTSYTGAMSATNSSTYVLGRSTNASAVNVRAIYETDLLTTSSPAGVYASVRRYEGTTLTDYYHVFYPGDTNAFRPLAVFFVREALDIGSASADTYRHAANRPFYFLWWPDPTVATLADRMTESFSNTNGLYEPRAHYYQMSGKTSFFFVVPAFPAL